jgi:hypothetical protein
MAPQVRPDGTVSVSVTTPVNPFNAVMVIVEVADEPVLTAAGDVAVIAKSGAAPKVNVAVAEWDREPLVPVMVTPNALWLVEVHESVALPEPVTLAGVIAPQVRPAGIVSVRTTTPANPFTAVTVIVDIAEDPAGTEAGELALIVKSRKVKDAIAEWVRDVLVPVTVSENVAAVEEEHDTVAVPEPVTLPGVKAPQFRPAGGVSVRVTTPVKPFTADMVIVDVADTPLLTAAGEVADMVKSCGAINVKVALAEWLSDPLVPVTARVNVPAPVELHETDADPEPVTLVGLMAPQVSPDGTVSVRETVPAKPPCDVIVMVDVADWPVLTAAGELAAIVKSCAVLNVSAAGAEWVNVVLVPVTVRV